MPKGLLGSFTREDLVAFVQSRASWKNDLHASDTPRFEAEVTG